MSFQIASDLVHLVSDAYLGGSPLLCGDLLSLSLWSGSCGVYQCFTYELECRMEQGSQLLNYQPHSK